MEKKRLVILMLFVTMGLQVIAQTVEQLPSKEQIEKEINTNREKLNAYKKNEGAIPDSLSIEMQFAKRFFDILVGYNENLHKPGSASQVIDAQSQILLDYITSLVKAPADVDLHVYTDAIVQMIAKLNTQCPSEGWISLRDSVVAAYKYHLLWSDK